MAAISYQTLLIRLRTSSPSNASLKILSVLILERADVLLRHLQYVILDQQLMELYFFPRQNGSLLVILPPSQQLLSLLYLNLFQLFLPYFNPFVILNEVKNLERSGILRFTQDDNLIFPHNRPSPVQLVIVCQKAYILP